MKRDRFKNIFPTKRNVFVWAMVVSLLFHVGILLKTVEISNFIKQAKTPPKKEKTSLKVVMRKESSDDDRNQIVQAQKDQKEKPKKETRFLSHSNQAVDRETVSKNIGKFKEAGKGSKQASKSRPKQKERQAKPRPRRKAIAKESKRKMRTPKDISWDALAKASQKVAKRALERSANVRKGIKRGLSGKSGLGQSNDHIEEIPLGDMTQLNTVEYKYYGFYNRIREKLERHWGKTLKEKAKLLYKGGNRMPASENKITSLIVTLDSKGQIVDIQVKSTSGVRAFDEAAVESFSKAGPFPNPPSGMVKNGKAQIEWGFVVKG